MNPLSSQLGLRLTDICDSLEKEVVGRVIKVYRFEPHPSRKILVIVGEVTISVVEPLSGKVKKQWTEEFKKFMHLLGLTKISNTNQVCRQVLATCSFIDVSMANKLEDAIDEIKQRDYDPAGVVVHTQMAADGSFLPRYPEIFDEYDLAESIGSAAAVGNDDEPDFGKLDNYIELLYEEIPQKIQASFYISKLTKSNSYLHDIGNRESATNALFRTLREDCKKSTHLTRNILSICLDLAKIKEFQHLLIKNKIPQLALDIIDFELERCEKWKAQLNCLEETATNGQNASSRALNEYHMMWIKLDDIITAQNSLLKVTFEMLHCVSENKLVREALVRQGVVTSLLDTLQRKDKDLLEVILMFLRDISSFRQGIQQMVYNEITSKLAKLLKGGVPIPKKAVNACLHLLYNLSFHSVLRESFVRCGLITILANCFGKKAFQDIVSKTLYILSMESGTRNKLAKTSIIKPLMNHLTDDSKGFIPVTMGSLGVNLARNKRCAELMWESNKLGLLVKNARKNEDALAMKIIRNLAEQDAGAFVLYESAGDIAGAIAGSTVQEFVTEGIGTLTYFDPMKVDAETVTQKGRIFPWLKQTLGFYLDQLERRPLDASGDWIRYCMDVISLIGNLCKSEDGARLVVGEGFADILMKIFLNEQTDPEIVQQILHVLNKCTEHESIAVFFALKTRVPNGLLEYLQSANGHLKQLCQSTLENIGQYDESWKENLQQFIFLEWNKEWVEANTLDENDENSEDEFEVEETGQDIRNVYQNLKCKGTGNQSNRKINKTLEENSDCSEIDWPNDNGNEHLSDDLLGLFRQQYEEEMAMQTKYSIESGDYLENDIEDVFDYDSDTDSGWQPL